MNTPGEGEAEENIAENQQNEEASTGGIAYNQVIYMNQEYGEEYHYGSDGVAFSYLLTWKDEKENEYRVRALFEDGLWRYFFIRQPFAIATTPVDQKYHTTTLSFESSEFLYIEEIMSFLAHPSSSSVDIGIRQRSDSAEMDIIVGFDDLEDTYKLTFSPNSFKLEQDGELVASEDLNQSLSFRSPSPMIEDGVNITRLPNDVFEIITEHYFLILVPSSPFYIGKLTRPMLDENEG